jgi:hypothetical protein
VRPSVFNGLLGGAGCQGRLRFSRTSRTTFDAGTIEPEV